MTTLASGRTGLLIDEATLVLGDGQGVDRGLAQHGVGIVQEILQDHQRAGSGRHQFGNTALADIQRTEDQMVRQGMGVAAVDPRQQIGILHLLDGHGGGRG